MRCQSCELLRINGVVCHEIGCPDAWRDEVRECRECGTAFRPTLYRHQHFCCEGCLNAYYGIDCEEEVGCE